ncbi:hypothetical protein ACUZXZ_01365 [Pseudomonas juntendi]
MHTNEFADQFQCKIIEHDRSELDEIAARYVQRTEMYDRSVCTGPVRHGVVMPATPHELGCINRNALRELDQLCEQFAHQYSRRELVQAIRRHDTR